MSAILYDYKCEACGNEFQASGVPELSYGEFILRSESGEEVYLEALCDETFKEVLTLVRRHPLMKKFDQKKSGEVTQNIFGLACDVAPNGEYYQINMMPQCPSCCSRKISKWSECFPRIESNILPVTHADWQMKTPSEKNEIVDRAIRKML